MKPQSQIWHSQSIENTFALLQTDVSGLTDREAVERLNQYGPNQLPSAARRNAFQRFFSQFHNVLIYVLLVSAIITGVLGHAVDTFVIVAVVLINAIIGYLQEGKAEKAMDAIRHMLAPMASVVREGRRCTVPAQSLVPGDMVLLEAGDKVPADLRLIKTHGLMIQEAILTGESVPVEKHIHVVDSNATLGDRSCMAFSGTSVTNGQGKGIVVATGTTTEIGRINRLLAEVENLTTPLITQMSGFARWLTFAILFFAALILLFGIFIQNLAFPEMFMIVVGLSVAAIPEGLPAVLTITLAIGVQRMAQRNAIVRRLPAIETLGSVSVICTDKTGTLTHNEMTVATALIHHHTFLIKGSGYAPHGKIFIESATVDPSTYPTLGEIARAATLCNDATLHEKETGWFIQGDPMEGALLTFARKVGLEESEEQKILPRTDIIPFDSMHRFMATLHHDHEGHAFVFVKGAPERILTMCSYEQGSDGKKHKLDHAYWREAAEAIAAQGQRVLALATQSFPAKHTVLKFSDIEKDLVLLGLVGLIDPPREDAIQAIAECTHAGIQVKMITGDHAKTALAIGQSIGLTNPNKVLTGTDLDAMDDASLQHATLETNIFARTSPEHKLRLVKALQAKNLVVAMTGDGVNDAPALKRADVGIAMGKKGSEVAKEASELVLADDNFSSIVAAIREGRTVYDNLKKVIGWTLPTNGGEALTIITAILFGFTLPLTPAQILWINLITSVTLGMALAFEPTEANTMRRPPRLRNEPLLSKSLTWEIFFVSVLFVVGSLSLFFWSLERHASVELARTLVLNTIVVLEIFYLFNLRYTYGASLTLKGIVGTPAVLITLAIVILAQLAITYLPLMQDIFHTRSLPFIESIVVIGMGIALFFIIEIEKWLRKKLGVLPLKEKKPRCI